MDLELGPLQLQRSEGFNFYVPTLIVNVGVLPGWEVVVDGLASVPVGSPRAAGSTGQLAVGLAVKGVVRRGSLQGGEGPSVAIEPELLFPSTAGPSEFGLAAGVIVSQRWPALTVHLNLVPAWSRSHQAAGLAGVIIEGVRSTGPSVRWAENLRGGRARGIRAHRLRAGGAQSGVRRQVWRSMPRSGWRRWTVRG